MTVDQLLAELRKISDDGFGRAAVMIEEVGDGYFGDLARVDTLMGGPNPTLTLLGTTREA